MHGVCCRNLQKRDRFRRVHRLWNSNILHNNSRDGRDGVSRLPRQLRRVVQRLYLGEYLHLQRRIHRARRRAVLTVSDWHVEERDRFRSMHRLPVFLRRDVCTVHLLDGLPVQRWVLWTERRLVHGVCRRNVQERKRLAGLHELPGERSVARRQRRRFLLYVQRRLQRPRRRRLRGMRRRHLQKHYRLRRVYKLSCLLRCDVLVVC
jgi:hypothetical protein